MRKIELPCCGIVVELNDQDHCGTIRSFLKSETVAGEDDELRAAMDAIESLILAHAVAGIDITTNAYIEGIKTAIAACWQAFD